MNRSNVLGADISVVEYQLAQKKAEYLNAIKKGEVFSELKKIFLEVKALQHRLQDVRSKSINADLRTAS
jgi:hypothetical protein